MLEYLASISKVISDGFYQSLKEFDLTSDLEKLRTNIEQYKSFIEAASDSLRNHTFTHDLQEALRDCFLRE